MRRKLALIFSMLFVVLVVCLHLSAEDGEMLGSGEGVGPDEAVTISLSNPYGTEITKIPKDDSYYITAMWSTPLNGYKATFIVAGIDQDTTRKFTHIIIKESTTSGIVGTACCTAVEMWANPGQRVPVIAQIKTASGATHGTGFKMFDVE